MNKKEELSGGRIGKIHKMENKVIRPSNPWTKHIHDFLQFCYDNKINFVPIPYGINENGEEVLSFVKGEVFNELPKHLDTDEMIISAAKLLSKFHMISQNYLNKLTGNEKWMLEKNTPIEILCHGDFAPYNVTIVDNLAFGIIDFDTLHPGSKLWDISYAIYRWTSIDAFKKSDISEIIRKIRLFLDAYGLSNDVKNMVLPTLIKRLEALVSFMKNEAENGNEDFQRNIDDGHLQKYLDDIEYLTFYQKNITNSILV